jgi:hypothetical protein
MKTKTTARTTRNLKLNLEVDPQEKEEGPLIEVEFPEAPDTLDRPRLDHRKEEASKPLYLARYE